MSLLVCEVREGARAAEATVVVTDRDGRKEFLPVDRGGLVLDAGQYWLPVGVLHVDESKKLALVTLPIEADSGAHRIVVRLDSLKEEAGVL